MLFLRNFSGCLSTDAHSLRQVTARWFVIGRERFEKELNIEKVLKTLRNLRIVSLAKRGIWAQLAIDARNVIEVDSEDIGKAE